MLVVGFAKLVLFLDNLRASETLAPAMPNIRSQSGDLLMKGNIMKLRQYKDTDIYHYWQRLAMPDNHRCVVCEHKLRPEHHVTVESYLHDEDGGAKCLPCSDKEGNV